MAARLVFNDNSQNLRSKPQAIHRNKEGFRGAECIRRGIYTEEWKGAFYARKKMDEYAVNRSF